MNTRISQLNSYINQAKTEEKNSEDSKTNEETNSPKPQEPQEPQENQETQETESKTEFSNITNNIRENLILYTTLVFIIGIALPVFFSKKIVLFQNPLDLLFALISPAALLFIENKFLAYGIGAIIFIQLIIAFIANKLLPHKAILSFAFRITSMLISIIIAAVVFLAFFLKTTSKNSLKSTATNAEILNELEKRRKSEKHLNIAQNAMGNWLYSISFAIKSLQKQQDKN